MKGMMMGDNLLDTSAGAGSATDAGTESGARRHGRGGGSGRAARQAARATGDTGAPAYITRKIGYFNLLDEEG
ncbi:MAG TPA: hypothetical protein DCG04_16860, partial [Rhodospirillaceae bacterium]|nr:hypothetical protein [Rhodospirillaceae bacterium]